MTKMVATPLCMCEMYWFDQRPLYNGYVELLGDDESFLGICELTFEVTNQTN